MTSNASDRAAHDPTGHDPIDGPVLALDSSTGGGSVALGTRERVAGEIVLEDGRSSSSTLLPAVDRLLREAKLAPGDLAAVVAGGGPGSFTGLRIAAATAKGIVRALDLPLFAYSGLLAAAALHRGMGRPVCALFDARNREVFAGCWRFGAGSADAANSVDESGSVDEVLALEALSVETLIERLSGTDRPLFTGDGAEMYRGEIEAAFGADSIAPPAGTSLAAGLLWLARTVPSLGRVDDAAAWEPDYLRASGAERIAAARGG
jgi:tRNA threonylcarbamoyladenosine biosynthesis protein TsaB